MFSDLKNQVPLQVKKEVECILDRLFSKGKEGESKTTERAFQVFAGTQHWCMDAGCLPIQFPLGAVGHLLDAEQSIC